MEHRAQVTWNSAEVILSNHDQDSADVILYYVDINNPEMLS